MAEPHPLDGPVADLVAACHAGRIDPGALLDDALARIAARNPGLNAIVGPRPDDLGAQVAALRRRLAAGERPPLAGVPVVVKDVVWVRGQRVTQGSRLFADFVAPRDALAVARLRAAGALIVGMGNSSEFACKGVTTNEVYGPTRHPLDPSLTPGGSSGGCAVAVAAGLAPLALGTDGGGSSRRPPAHVGVVGFKPSFGAIPDPDGFAHPFPGLQVIAPIARRVDDAARMFAALAGPDPRDPDAVRLDAAPPRPARTLRIASSPRFGLDVPVDPDVEAAFAAAVGRLRAAGWAVEQRDPTWPPGVGEDALMPLQHAGLAALHGEAWQQDPSRFDPDIARQIERGLQWRGTDVARAREAGVRVARTLGALLAEVDLLLCPTAPCVAWPLGRLGPASIGGRAVEPRAHAVFTPFVNHAGAAAISLPCGGGRDGLPVGLQMIAARGRDAQLLAAAAEAETLLAHPHAPCASSS